MFRLMPAAFEVLDRKSYFPFLPAKAMFEALRRSARERQRAFRRGWVAFQLRVILLVFAAKRFALQLARRRRQSVGATYPMMVAPSAEKVQDGRLDRASALVNFVRPAVPACSSKQ